MVRNHQAGHYIFNLSYKPLPTKNSMNKTFVAVKQPDHTVFVPAFLTFVKCSNLSVEDAIDIHPGDS